MASRCPRCGGTLFLQQDHDSAYHGCLQCGYVRDLALGGTLEDLLAETLRPLRARLPSWRSRSRWG